MKKTMLFIALIFSSTMFSQTETFKPVHFEAALIGSVEVNGHIINSTKENREYVFIAEIDYIEIKNKEGDKFEYRKCGIENCKTIHLNQISGSILNSGGITLTPYTYPTDIINNLRFTPN